MNLKKLTAGTLAVFAAAALLAGCGGEKKTEKAPEEKKKIVVGITPGYSEEIMEFVKDEAKKQGLDVELKVFSDYVTPDQALAQKEIDLLMDIVLQLCDEGTYHMHLVQPSCFAIPPHLCLGALSPQQVTVIFNHPKKGFLAFDVKNLALSSALFDFIEYIQEDETFTLPEEISRKVVQETLEKLRAQQR